MLLQVQLARNLLATFSSYYRANFSSCNVQQEQEGSTTNELVCDFKMRVCRCVPLMCLRKMN